MSMRSKTTLLIMMIVLAATGATFLAGLYFTNKSLERTVEQDLSFAIGIANSLVSMEMKLEKTKAATVAARLSIADSAEKMRELMKEQFNASPEITHLTVFDRNSVIAGYSVPEHKHELPDDGGSLEKVYAGGTIMSSPFHCSARGEFIINIYTPMGSGRILAMSVPGLVFTDTLSRHRLWRTGEMFMINDSGTFIGAADEEIVLAMGNYLTRDKTAPGRPDDEEMEDLIRAILSTDDGVREYSVDGVTHLCAYSRIDDSLMGWRVAVTAPLSESPQADALSGQGYAAAALLAIGAASAFFLARLIARPFKEIQRKNGDLVRLNETIRTQAEAIREEHGRIKLMMDATPLACRLWDRRFKLVECNEAAVKLFGLRNKQEYLERYFELSPEFQPDGRTTLDKIKMSIGEAFETGKCRYEWMYRAVDGASIPCEVTMVRVPYGNDHVVAAYSRDLREQKRMLAEIEQHEELLQAALREAKEANSAKSSFLANMSHEMRTPLNAVIGLSELTLGDAELDGETKSNLEKIYEAGTTLLSIVNNILDISKIEAGKFELIQSVYDVSSMVNDAVTQNVLRIGSRSIQFILDIVADMPARLFGDELRIKQIINNLLSNAFKYTEDGRVELGLAWEREEDTVWLTIHVADTGRGIRPEDHARLFDDYSRFDAAANRHIGGTGLGLSITKRLVEMMDGRIAVESEYGRGSIFTARIRQRHVGDEVIGTDVVENLRRFRYSASKRDRNALNRLKLPYARVLVVDDNITNLDVARGLMKPYGMKIDCVTGGQEAVDAIRRGEPKYNAVFMDHMMPGVDGMEATRRIRGLGTEYARTIPVIALTANAIAGNEKIFLSEGFQAFIPKPIDLTRLDNVIRSFVRDKELETSCDNGDAQVPDDFDGQDETRPPAQDYSIEGLDILKGVERFGSEKTFMRVLRSYAVNTKPLLESIETVGLDSLSPYATTVHGIKGASRNICAETVGNLAEALEREAKAGNFGFVAGNNKVFLTVARKLIGDIDSMLAGMEQSKPVKGKPDVEFLASLRAACESYDFDGVDSAMEEIESYEYNDDGGLVAWLRTNVTQMNFPSIIEKLSRLGKDSEERT